MADASTEQAVGILQVNGAVSHMDEMTQMNAVLVEQASDNSRSVMSQVQQMAALMAFFQSEDQEQSSADVNGDVVIPLDPEFSDMAEMLQVDQRYVARPDLRNVA